MKMMTNNKQLEYLGKIMTSIWSALKSRIYFRVVCMWSYREWYPNVDEHGKVIEPLSYHKELEWPIHIGIAWIPRAGNLCIDLIAFRIFFSIDPFWERPKDWHASMLEMGKMEWDSMSKKECWQAGYDVAKHEEEVKKKSGGDT